MIPFEELSASEKLDHVLAHHEAWARWLKASKAPDAEGEMTLGEMLAGSE